MTTSLRLRSGIRPLTFLLIVAAAIALQCCSGCATATRITVTTPEKTVTVILPKNYSAARLDFDLDPETGEIRLRTRKLRADASGVIESVGGASGDVIEKIAPLVPSPLLGL